MKILMKFNGKEIKDVETDKSEITIGRAPENDIQIDNLAVSNVHARIVREQNHCFIEDLNSTNSTLVNGKKINKKYLMENDEINICKHFLYVYFEKHGHKRNGWIGNAIVDKTYKIGPARQS
jgi:pSer/pThr/pTyr-binding forkhead associated (FHA) protein